MKMLLTLGLLVLLTPFHSFQTIPDEKRDSTGSDTTKPDVVLALSKPKTTVTLSKPLKQAPRSTLKPNTVDQTVLITSTTTQKPSAGSNLKLVKDKPNRTVIPTVLPTASKPSAASVPVNPPKKANQTAVIKSSPGTTVKTAKLKPATTAAPTAPPTPPKTSTTSSPVVVKDKPAPVQPIKVVISEGCDSNQTKEQEVKLKPGAPLVMTHKISLVPGGCTGNCVVEMAALKGRVARLEKEMASLKQKCPCSSECPNDCYGNGKCEKGKCVCFQGFLGVDCKSKEKVKLTVETTTLQVSQVNNAIKETAQMKKPVMKVEQTLFQKKDQKNVNEIKDADKTKVGIVKTLAKQGASTSKTTTKVSTGGVKVSRPTVGQVLLKHTGGKQEEARTGKTTVLTTKKLSQTDLNLKENGKEDVAGKTHIKSGQSTSTVVTILITGLSNKTRPGKETVEQSTFVENDTRSFGKKTIKKVKEDTVNATKVVQSVNTTRSETVKTVSGKGKVSQMSQYMVNVTTSQTADVSQNKTTVQFSGNTTRKAGGMGLGSVKVENVTSYSFTLVWSAPQGMFKNFTVIRREYRVDGDEEEEDEDIEEGAFDGDDKAAVAKNATDVQVQSESVNGTTAYPKAPGSRAKTEGKRVSLVLPGSVRNMEFINLRPQTRYALYIFGTSSGKRSKIHRVTATTGPEPVTELLLSNVTESSLTVSWSKPKSIFTGFKIIYTHTVTGESKFVTVTSQQSHVVLPKLSAGSSYTISVMSMQGKVLSDALTTVITTVPAPPTHLEVINVTDTKAVLQWTPSLGKVDRFIISYESSKTPNVTVTVMVSGTSVEHQLRGLQRGTLYTVKVLSQKDSLQSTGISTTFTTANVVKASEVSARSAVISWRTTIVYHSYRLIYYVVGEEPKELILDPSLTEYKLTGLMSMSKYIILVQGERDGRYTPLVTTEFFTGKLRFPFPTECSQELLNGALQSGEVDIYPRGKEGGAVRVYCDMETDGGGWTVFQRRMNGKTDFYRTWSEYSVGFGNLSEEFWLGNELLHNLTSLGPVSLRVDLRSGNDTAYAHYANFTIDSEEKQYAITLSGYTGTAGDSMKYHNERPFSTRDKDPNPLGIHCARAYMGGWWYKNCYKTNLNGLYSVNSNNQGIVWIDWKGKDFSIPFTEMKIRPAGFSPMTHG